MSSNIYDSKKIHEISVKHDRNPDKFHAAVLKLHPKQVQCGLCSQPLKKIKMTYKTKMTITIRSRMTTPIFEGDCGDPNGKPITREYQKKLHEAIAWAIFNNVEWARDDNDRFDATALEHTEIQTCGIEKPEISDYAEISIDYQHGKTKWRGERVPTKAERNPKGMIET